MTEGEGYLFRLTKFALGEGYSASILLLAAQDDFVQNVRKLQFNGTRPRDHRRRGLYSDGLDVRQHDGACAETHYGAGAPASDSWRSPSLAPVTSHIREIHELGATVNLAQRAIWSFAHFVPKEIVRRVIDNSISTRLGGVKQEITLVFTDVQGFTTIAESADPDMLMQQTSRYFSVLTASVPRRRRHGRQVYRRRGHGVLERAQSASQTMSRAPAGRRLQPRPPARGSTRNSRPKA